MICCALSNSDALADCVMSPVWSMKAGVTGIASILSMASLSVPATSWLAALLKPMWLSLICTKLKAEPAAARVGVAALALTSFETGTPPAMDQSNPVPAHAMQLRKLRRSIPSPGPQSWGESCASSDVAGASSWDGVRLFCIGSSAHRNRVRSNLFPAFRNKSALQLVCVDGGDGDRGD